MLNATRRVPDLGQKVIEDKMEKTSSSTCVPSRVSVGLCFKQLASPTYYQIMGYMLLMIHAILEVLMFMYAHTTSREITDQLT